MPWYLYVVKCSDQTLYTGITTDIPRRVKEHNTKKGAFYTQNKTPVELVYREDLPSRSAALRREAEIKRLTRKEKLDFIKAKVKKSFFIAAFLFIFLTPLFAADLDSLYLPLLKKGEYLLSQDFEFFKLKEKSLHGSTTYESVSSSPAIYTLDTSLKTLLRNNLEGEFLYNQAIPSDYCRKTDYQSGGLGVVQDYHLNYLRDYGLNLRLRKEPFEAYLSVLEMTQRDDWRSAMYPGSPDYFTYIRAHFENFNFGIRFITREYNKKERKGFALLGRPLLDKSQFNLETELGFKGGSVRRNSFYYSGGTTLAYNYHHRLGHHFIPKINAAYGIKDNWELGSGLSFTSPYKYYFEFKRMSTTSTRSLRASYRLDKNYKVPLNLRFRPRETLEFLFSSEFTFARQRLDYWIKETSGAITGYESKKLDYFNTQPTLTLTYFYDARKDIKTDDFSRLNKRLLSRGQFLLGLTFQKDFTHLNKNNANGPQNIIEPYNIFLYPLDNFVSGSEYAAFFTGNTTSSATDVRPQNFYLYQLSFNYGLTDRLNAEMRVGYHSSSSLHHFTLGNYTITPSPYDLRSRFYVFKPFYYFDLISEFRMTKNSLISLGWHYVPEYTTIIDIQDLSEEFKDINRYHQVSLAVKILF